MSASKTMTEGSIVLKYMATTCDCTKYNGGQCYNCLNGAHHICDSGQGHCSFTAESLRQQAGEIARLQSALAERESIIEFRREENKKLVVALAAAERRCWELEAAKDTVNPAWSLCGWTLCHVCDDCGTTWGTDSKHVYGKLTIPAEPKREERCPRCRLAEIEREYSASVPLSPTPALPEKE